MPKWTEYLTHARERGSLALELFCVVTTPTGDMDLLRSTLPDHLAWVKAQEAAGVVAFAGPLSDETGEEMEGMGMLILRADSFDAARALADQDPMHASGARTYVLRRWMINEGSLTLRVDLAGQAVRLS